MACKRRMSKTQQKWRTEGQQKEDLSWKEYHMKDLEK